VNSMLDKQKLYDEYYMDLAVRAGQMSYDKKYKVGCVIVLGNQIVSDGWNGMPAGMPNQTRDKNGKTNPEVIHSEDNALRKMKKLGLSAKGATIYCTYSPCAHCVKLLKKAGIARVVYKKTYDKEALKLLKGIEYERISSGGRISTGQNQENPG